MISLLEKLPADIVLKAMGIAAITYIVTHGSSSNSKNSEPEESKGSEKLSESEPEESKGSEKSNANIK